MYEDEEYNDFEEYGKAVELHQPERGYTYGHIVGRSGYKYIIQLSSGLEVTCYDDDFDYV